MYVCGLIHFGHAALPCRLRVDKGTETMDLATIHSYLRSQRGDLEEAMDSRVLLNTARDHSESLGSSENTAR